MEDVVQSPLFVFNSKYDAWQVASSIQPGPDSSPGPSPERHGRCRAVALQPCSPAALAPAPALTLIGARAPGRATPQLANELQTKWATAAEQKAVLQYGEDFLAQFEPLKANPKNGAMITSCICHGCPWTELALEGKTTYEHYAAWASGKDTGAAAFHIDPRTPNGDGNITYSQCSKFP